MKWHVLRPLWVAIGVVGAILIARAFLVPDDFGVHGKNFTYGYYRLSNIQEWRNFRVKYQGREYCLSCHADNVESLNVSAHAQVECENCHGPAVNHPGAVPTLDIDTSREHCLRCHALSDYPYSSRAAVPAIDNNRHRRRRDCVRCHNPHDPRGDSE